MTRLSVLFIAIFLLALPAHARLDILPRIVVMEPRDRSSEITILNITDEQAFYRITILHYRQNPDGTYETLDAPLSPLFDPAEAVRMSPRQFQLGPQGRQKIRLSLRKPEGLPPGEYRFHVLATRYDAVSPLRVNPDEEAPLARVGMNVGFAIPVVIRHGDVHGTAGITNARFIPSGQEGQERNVMSVTIARDGTKSAIGELAIYRGEEQIGFITNFNVFNEINQRTIDVPLRIDPRGAGEIRLEYTSHSGELIDVRTLQL